jgi:hypothetical protein
MPMRVLCRCGECFQVGGRQLQSAQQTQRAQTILLLTLLTVVTKVVVLQVHFDITLL